MKCREVKHYSLLVVKSVSFSHHINSFFRMHIYRHGSLVKTVILQAIAHMQRHHRITSISAYFDYMRAADAIDSQKSEDCDITGRLP
jgi:hypothetical protein